MGHQLIIPDKQESHPHRLGIINLVDTHSEIPEEERVKDVPHKENPEWSTAPDGGLKW